MIIFIYFKWSNIRGENEEDIAKANLIESLQKQAYKEIYPEKVAGGLFDYYGTILKEIKQKIRRFSSQ